MVCIPVASSCRCRCAWTLVGGDGDDEAAPPRKFAAKIPPEFVFLVCAGVDGDDGAGPCACVI